MKTILMRGSSHEENELAVEALNLAGISFSQMYSTTNNKPILIPSDESFPYKGVSSIKEYCETHS